MPIRKRFDQLLPMCYCASAYEPQKLPCQSRAYESCCVCATGILVQAAPTAQQFPVIDANRTQTDSSPVVTQIRCGSLRHRGRRTHIKSARFEKRKKGHSW